MGPAFWLWMLIHCLFREPDKARRSLADLEERRFGNGTVYLRYRTRT